MVTERYRIIYDRKELSTLTDKAWELNTHSQYRVGIRRDVVTIESPGNGIDKIAEYLLGHLSSKPLKLTEEPFNPVAETNVMPEIPKRHLVEIESELTREERELVDQRAYDMGIEMHAYNGGVRPTGKPSLFYTKSGSVWYYALEAGNQTELDHLMQEVFSGIPHGRFEIKNFWKRRARPQQNYDGLPQQSAQ